MSALYSYQSAINNLADILVLDDKYGGPLDRAVRLVEYVAHTKGAEHLKLGSRHLNDWQGWIRFSVDFKALLVVLRLKQVNVY
jgi:hypothetical protein